MMENPLPLKRDFRNRLISHMAEASAAQDPLSYLQTFIFTSNPEHVTRIPSPSGRALFSFYLDVVKYCEVSAWAEEPPLIVSLLEAFKPVHEYPDVVKAIMQGGPYRCHPSTQPFWVCRVASELPLFGRGDTRLAAIQFASSNSVNSQPGSRVLRVNGPTLSGKSYTLDFFLYLAAIQPLELGVLHLDFGEGDYGTLAENQGLEVELYIARRLEEQARRWREKKLAANESSALPLPGGVGLPAIGLPAPVGARASKPAQFTPLTDLQQRPRWASQLASEFISQALERTSATPPAWWVIVLDRCEKIPQQAEEFVRQLVQKAAGTDRESADQADRGPLRMVLLGDSSKVMPNPIYQDHVVEEDLTIQTFGQAELVTYFHSFFLSRLIRLHNDNDVYLDHLRRLADESITRAQQIINEATKKPTWLEALAVAVNEKTKPLETLAAQKRAGGQPPQNGGA